MEHGRRRRGSGRDRISGLPDELLHGILRHLHSAPAAARTSALSRRWRRVWAHLPELVLGDDLIHRGASFLAAVDGALAAYESAAPDVHVDGLEITVPYRCQDVPARRVAPWLSFASRRLAGAFDLLVPLSIHRYQRKPWLQVYREEDELELPPCERATRINLVLGARFLLRLPPAAMFAALTDLEIHLATMEGRELEVLVSSQCPRLRNLSLVITLVAASDVSVRSASLRHLKFHVRNTRRFDVAAPNLQVLDASRVADAHIAAPNLAEVVWGESAQFVFADAGRHLRRLDVTRCSAMAPLMRRFDSVDELRLHAPIGIGGFKRFLDDTNNLPKCETLWVSSIGNPHGFVPSVLHLLRRGNGIKKLVVSAYPLMTHHCSLACPCRLPESSMADDIILDSLVEIEINLFRGADEDVEFLEKLLSIWSRTKLKSVKINMLYHASSLSGEVRKKIRGMCRPDIRVELNMFPKGRFRRLN